MNDNFNAEDERGNSTDPENLPRRRSAWGTVEGRVISFVSRKGGVGKTTSAVNLGAALALSGHSVLVVGTDPQCGVCRTLGDGPDSLETKLGDLFTGNPSLLDLVHTSPLDNLHFISPGISTLDEEEEYQEQLARKADDFAAAVDHARNFYDSILIDCPPSLGPATRASLLASDSFLVPVQAEELCRESLHHLLDFLNTFRERHFTQEVGFLDLAPDQDGAETAAQPLALEGLFLTMASEQTRMGKHVAARVQEDFSADLFATGIPRNTRLSEMALKGKPAVIFDRRSKGSRAYFDLADELVDRYRLVRGQHLGKAEEDPAETAAEMSASGSDFLAPEAESESTGGGLEGFLAALGGARAVSSSIPNFEEPAAPEMVSLDELLAEEEEGQGRSSDDWDDGIWPDKPHRFN